MGSNHDISTYTRDGCVVDYAQAAAKRGVGSIDAEPHRNSGVKAG